MKEYTLNQTESLTVMDIVQDAMDRGMIAKDYETDTLGKIISENTDEFEQFKKGVEFEVVIRVKGASNENL